MPFTLFKAEYQQQLLHLNNILYGHKMSSAKFFRVLVPAYTTAMIPEAIIAGFRNTVIFPVTQQAEKLKQIHASNVYDKCKS